MPMQRVVEGTIKHDDGTEQRVQHISTDDPVQLAAFITGFTDDRPGVPFTFTVTSTGTRH